MTRSAEVSRIVAVYRAATPRQHADGLAWYSDAHTMALAFSPDDVRRGAAVIALLSQRNNWRQNVKQAARAFADGKASGCMFRVRDAVDAVLGGADPDAVVRGPKISAFYRTIVDPAGNGDVVIDRHAHDVVMGRVCTDAERKRSLERKASKRNPRSGYDTFADYYREAASILGVHPCIVQAVTWVRWIETEAVHAAANAAAAEVAS